MRIFSGVSYGVLVLLLLSAGCRTVPRNAPLTPAVAPSTDIVTDFHVGESMPAVFEVTIDPSSLSATSQPLASRSGAGFQASQYDLDVTKFQTAAQFQVRSVQFTPIGDIELTFRHAHPWGPVDLSQPPSATNRADLGYTGRLLILADLDPSQVSSHTFFGDVIANSELIRGADGYVQPGDLLARTGFNANCFPYMLLADEAKDNRIGVSNNNVVTGNWDPAVGGWQRSNLGPNGDGWTGYDFVHAGQTIENSFVLNADELTGGPITLQVALLIKYTEPKGVGGEAGRLLRLPPETVDVLQFAYRAPHAALDVSRITQHNALLGLAVSFVPLEISPGRAQPVYFRTRDWDADAAISTTPDLAEDPVPASVEPGASGVPRLELSAPALWSGFTELLPTPEPPLPNGLPKAELRFGGTIVNEFGAPPITDHPGLLRVIDPSVSVAAGSPHYGVDPITLEASETRSIPAISYQAFSVRVGPDLPTWVTHSVDPSSSNGHYPSIAILPNVPEDPTDDRLAVAYQDLSARDVKLAIAQRLDPRTAADWLVHTVDASADVGYGINLVHHADRLLMIYSDFGRARIACAQSRVPVPASGADWSFSAVTSTPPGPAADQIRLFRLQDGTLQLIYLQEPDHTLQVGLCMVGQPEGPADWGVQQVDGTLRTNILRVALYQDRLVAVVTVVGTLIDQIAASDASLPVALTDWRIHDPIPPNWQGSRQLNRIIAMESRLAVLVSATAFRVSKPEQPASANDWQTVRIQYGSVLGSSAFASTGNTLYLASDHNPSLQVHRTMQYPAWDSEDWQLAVVRQDPDCCGLDNQDTAAIWFQDRLFITHRGTGANSHLQCAWNLESW